VPTRAHVNDDADRRGNIGGQSAAHRLDRGDTACGSPDGDDASLLSAHGFTPQPGPPLTLSLLGLGAEQSRETILADRTFSQNQLLLRPNRASRVGPMNSGARRGDPIDRAGQIYLLNQKVYATVSHDLDPKPRAGARATWQRELVRCFEHNSRRESEREKIFLFFWR
jgi:hypothetical protein